MTELISFPSAVGSISIGNTVKNIKKYSFAATYITSISAPNAQIIEEYAFASCKHLNSVDIPVVESIGLHSFYDDEYLTNVVMLVEQRGG